MQRCFLVAFLAGAALGLIAELGGLAALLP